MPTLHACTFRVSGKRIQACLAAVMAVIALSLSAPVAAAPEDEEKGYPDIKVRKPNGGEIWVREEIEMGFGGLYGLSCTD